MTKASEQFQLVEWLRFTLDWRDSESPVYVAFMRKTGFDDGLLDVIAAESFDADLGETDYESWLATLTFAPRHVYVSALKKMGDFKHNTSAYGRVNRD